MLRQTPGRLEAESSHEWVDGAFLAKYFRWDDDLPAIYHRLAQDVTAKALTKRYRGLRLIRQDPWECLVSYVCAIFKNIPAIQRMLDALARRFGAPIPWIPPSEFALPYPQQLALASVNALRACGTGFRARFLIDLARRVGSGEIDLEALRDLGYDEARVRLLSPGKALGLGPKVVDCLLLFAFGKLEAFPIDVWIARAILERYGSLLEPERLTQVRRAVAGGSLSASAYDAVARRLREYFGPYGGYAQQLLYHHFRTKKPVESDTLG